MTETNHLNSMRIATDLIIMTAEGILLWEEVTQHQIQVSFENYRVVLTRFWPERERVSESYLRLKQRARYLEEQRENWRRISGLYNPLSAQYKLTIFSRKSSDSILDINEKKEMEFDSNSINMLKKPLEELWNIGNESVLIPVENAKSFMGVLDSLKKH